eukprot:1372238-Amphidinium_carterae.1
MAWYPFKNASKKQDALLAEHQAEQRRYEEGIREHADGLNAKVQTTQQSEQEAQMEAARRMAWTENNLAQTRAAHSVVDDACSDYDRESNIFAG